MQGGDGFRRGPGPLMKADCLARRSRAGDYACRGRVGTLQPWAGRAGLDPGIALISTSQRLAGRRCVPRPWVSGKWERFHLLWGLFNFLIVRVTPRCSRRGKCK